jgi:hypothetical protein
MKTVIAESSIASTNLVNSLQSINREVERASDNQVVAQRFDICKQLRRRVLRYVRDIFANFKVHTVLLISFTDKSA